MNKGVPGGKSNQLSRLPGYGFLLPHNPFKRSKGKNEGNKTSKIYDFMKFNLI